MLVMSNLRMFRYDRVWEKNKSTGFLNAKKMPLRRHETYTAPGDMVLDNACGSGTTGLAAQNLGRRYILMEADSGYCEKARKRLGLL